MQNIAIRKSGEHRPGSIKGELIIVQEGGTEPDRTQLAAPQCPTLWRDDLSLNYLDIIVQLNTPYYKKY